MNRKKVKLLRGVHFDFEDAEISLTTKGAASKVDQPFLLKSLVKQTKKGSESLDKGVHTDVNKTKPEGDTMSEEMLKKVLKKLEEVEEKLAQKELQEEIAVVANTFRGYGLGEELAGRLAEAFQGEQAELVKEALEALTAKAVEAIETLSDDEVEVVDVEVEAKKELEDEEDNAIAKALRKEVGHSQVHKAKAQDNSLLARVRAAKQSK